MRRILKARALLALGLAALLCLSGCGFASGESGSVPSHDTTSAETASYLTFRTEDKLQQHFEKHGQETGCAIHEYEHDPAARAFGEETVEKLGIDPTQAFKTLMVRLEPTGEFVVVSPAGYIRTYYLTDRDYFERQ